MVQTIGTIVGTIAGAIANSNQGPWDDGYDPDYDPGSYYPGYFPGYYPGGYPVPYPVAQWPYDDYCPPQQVVQQPLVVQSTPVPVGVDSTAPGEPIMLSNQGVEIVTFSVDSVASGWQELTLAPGEEVALDSSQFKTIQLPGRLADRKYSLTPGKDYRFFLRNDVEVFESYDRDALLADVDDVALQ